MPAIPILWKLIGGGVILAGLVAGFFWVRSTWIAEGERRCAEANRKAVEEQIRQDRALSARLVEGLQRELETLRSNANADRASIVEIPVTTGCGPSVDRAIDVLRRRKTGPAQ